MTSTKRKEPPPPSADDDDREQGDQCGEKKKKQAAADRQSLQAPGTAAADDDIDGKSGKKKQEEREEEEKKVEEKEKEPPPRYGSKLYWERRYKHLKVPNGNYGGGDEDGGGEEEKDKDEDGDDEESVGEVSALPNHAWYFSYSELRPLILPLLLGKRDFSPETFFSGDEEEGNEENEEEGGECKDDEEAGQENGKKEEAEGGDNARIDGDEDAEAEAPSSDPSPDDPKNNAPADDHDGNVAEAVDVSQDDDETDQPAEEGDRTSSTDAEQHPPKSVLEIGCGDVPLGYAILLDLLNMQRDTGADAAHVVDRIVCTDYARTVVDVLRERQRGRWAACGMVGAYRKTTGEVAAAGKADGDGDDDGAKEEEKKKKVTAAAVESVAVHPDPAVRGCAAAAGEEGAIATTRSTLDVAYVVEDARAMPHPDETFDLVLDKGTMDAMLSDKVDGIPNCVKIVAEMARVLRVDGYIFIVSHMNANIQSGLEWVDQVIVAGLRAGGADADWEVEIHGSDGTDGIDDCDDEEDEEEGVEMEEEEGGQEVANDGDEVGEGSDVDEETGPTEHENSQNDGGPPSGSPGPAVYIIRKTAAKKNANSEGNGEETGGGDEELSSIPLKFFTY